MQSLLKDLLECMRQKQRDGADLDNLVDEGYEAPWKREISLEQS